MTDTYFYRVGKGERIADIAGKFEMSVEELTRGSGIRSVAEGDRLIVQTVSAVTHTVKISESLDDIARLYGVRVEDILRLNKSDRIYTGQKLKIPVR